MRETSGRVDIRDLETARDAERVLTWTPPAGTPEGYEPMSILPGNELQVRLIGRGGTVEARVDGVVRVLFPCDRCLAPTEEAVPVHYRQRFTSPEAYEAMPAPEREGEEDGAPWAPFDDHAVDLFPGLLQNVSLGAAPKHLCDPGCRGLCPTCGKNLNEGDCACRPESGDPRLAALAEWAKEQARQRP